MNYHRENGMLGGRPSILNRELGQKIINDVRTYLSINFAGEGHGIARSTIQSWIKRGNEDGEAGIDSDYAWFSQNIRIARADFIKEATLVLKENKTNWQSTAWLLERCCGEDYGKDSELYKQLLEDYKMLMQAMLDKGKG